MARQALLFIACYWDLVKTKNYLAMVMNEHFPNITCVRNTAGAGGNDDNYRDPNLGGVKEAVELNP